MIWILDFDIAVFFFWQATTLEAFAYMEQVTSSGFLTPAVCLQISLSSEHTPWLWSAWSWDIGREPCLRVRLRWNPAGIFSKQNPRLQHQ